MIPAVPLVKLNNGHSMPTFGLGTWQMDESEAEAAVKQAIDLGYRLFDTAFIYHNEVAIGKAIRQKIQEGVVKREDIFVVSKSKKESSNPQVFDSFDDTSLEDTWREMEKCVDEGLVRSIGLSNFNSVQVTRILNVARIKPVCNQVEVHVGFHQRPLIRFCHERNVEVVGYCPLGAPNRPVKQRNEKSVLDQPVVMQMASTHGKTPAQIALRYLVQLGVTPIPKSNTKQHMIDNINIFGFELSEEEMATLDGLNSEDRVMMYPLARHHLDWPFKIPF